MNSQTEAKLSRFTAVQSFRTADGEVFATEALAEAHANKLEFAEEIKTAVESYANQAEMVGRKRAAQINAASDFLGFYLGWDKVAIERTVFDPVVEVVEVAAEGAVEGADVAAVEGAEGAAPDASADAALFQ